MNPPRSPIPDPPDHSKRPADAASSGAPVDPEWIRDFEASLRRPLRERFDYAFISTRQPVIHDRSYSTFETMEGYRRWCRDELPAYMGYA